ncbi:MAG TPA: NAD(P)/FAD-dependent oxidoreductase [Gammaproteobacteria bacterium]|nr:NAD(P)/FAD-dependent oxidoreductase [Gammaproteobacteria bacterium]
MPKARPPVGILGAGLAGSLLAVMLARRGFGVRVYERRPDMRKQDAPAGRSINLALAERGIDALRKAGVFDLVKPLLIAMRGRMLHDGDGDQSLQPYGQRESEVIYSISRRDLNRRLMTVADRDLGVAFTFNQRCTGADFAAGKLHMHDETDGRVYDLPMSPVIAADGAGSSVRQAMAGAGLCESREETLEHSYKELEIPAGAGGRHQLEQHALHVWPRGGFMLIALPNLDGSFTVTLFLPRRGPESFASLADEAALRDFFARSFPDALALMPDLADDFFRNPTCAMGTVRCAPWAVEGRALLLGDAAHAIVPFHGQGMNCAFEDCAVLDELLREHGDRWTDLFADFESRRKPDTDAIAEMALENYVEMRDAVRDPRFQLEKEIAFELERRHPGVFIPRYSMVMFHPEITYAEAQRRGAVQAGILNELSANASSPADVDFALADELVRRRLSP